MKKSSMILLGYGLGYIIISILVATNFISLSSKDILPLSVASLIFSLAEFWNVGVRLIILSIRQLAFRFFAMMAFTRFKKFKTYVEHTAYRRQRQMCIRDRINVLPITFLELCVGSLKTYKKQALFL